MPPAWVLDALHAGCVIPAHPLALNNERKLDERRQRALTRYYHAAGAGGIAVGVHTTQFEIRNPEHGLLEPVLALAAETVAADDERTGRRTIRIAGILGPTPQALDEARLARKLGYHAGLLCLSALKDSSEAALMCHCRAIAREFPVVGFYLQPAAGGRILGASFWRSFVEIPNVVAIKIAPFNRYQTLDVIGAVAESGRAGEIALYTGNDDNIVLDLIARHCVRTRAGIVDMRFSGGLLGQWACWTSKAVELLESCKRVRNSDSVPAALLALAADMTAANAAIFDAANNFTGSIAGVLEVLRRQGLLENNFCLCPDVRLSQGQRWAIEAVCRDYPHLTDDDFVARHRKEWLGSVEA